MFWLIGVLNVVVLALAAAPFLLWEGFGPDRFDTRALGGGGVLQPAGDASDPWDDQASAFGDEADWRDELPFDLGPGTRITLVFSVGSRDMGADEARRLRVGGVEARGSDGLTDSIMLVIADRDTDEVALLSIPRDLWLFDRGHRINATLNHHGLAAFVDDVSRVTGLPIHHLVQVNFAAFADLVDAIGGIPVAVDRPLADLKAKLYVPTAGCWLLDGADALAYARSRSTLTRSSDGGWRHDATASDFGRIDRQQQLVRAAWDRVRETAGPSTVPDLLTTVRRGLVVDEDLGVQQVRDLLGAFRHVPAGGFEGYTLPTVGRRIGAAAAQVLDVEEARDVLTRLRTWPPTGEDTPHDAHVADGTTVVAAGAGGPWAADTPCTADTASRLPDPTGPLAEVRRTSGGGADDGRDTDGEPGEPTPSSSPDDRRTEEPTEEPSPGPTTTEFEPGPTEDPSEESTEDDDLLPLPFDDDD